MKRKKDELIRKQHIEKIARLTSPERILKLRLFKNSILNHEILCSYKQDGIEYKGLLDKYTGFDIRIVDNENNVILSKNKGVDKEMLKLFDRSGHQIIDPFLDD